MKKKRRKKALWWSSFHCYETCPKQFLYKYGIIGEVDPTPAPPRSEHHILMGVVVQAVIEDFYNDKLWLSPSGKVRPTKELVDLLVGMTRSCFRSKLPRFNIEWRVSPDEGELLDTCLKGVLGYLRTMKAHNLLGEENVAEHKSVVDMGGFAIGAKPDVIIKRVSGDDQGITIIDGKNGNPAYVHQDQLRFYALIFYREHGMLPDRIGFVWYRYPTGSEFKDGTPSSGVEWVSCDLEDLEGLALRIQKVHKGISSKEFDANPAPSQCRFCDWEGLCQERQAQKRKNAARRNKNKKPPEGESLGGGFKALEMGE